MIDQTFRIILRLSVPYRLAPTPVPICTTDESINRMTDVLSGRSVVYIAKVHSVKARNRARISRVNEGHIQLYVHQ